MAGFGLLLSLGGTLLSAAGASQAADAEAAAAEANARALERKAMQERAAASVAGERRTRDARRVISQQQAGFASSGGGLGGSAGTVIAETGRRGLQDSRLEVWGGEQRARGYEDQAEIDRYAARQRRKAAGISAGAALLTGFSKVAGSGTFIGASESGGYQHYY